jgi:hypothetical protein
MAQLGEALSERDRRLLRDVADLRLVTGSQLQRLAFAGPGASSHNARVARRALERLTRLGLLQRLHRRVGGVRAGSSSFVYAVTPAGGEAIGRQVSRGRVREPRLTFLTHQLAVAEIVVMLREAHDRGVLQELHIETEPTCWRPLDDGTASILKPDLYVSVVLADEELLAFLEFDNDTEHAAALDRKTALYRAHYRSGREQQAEGVFPEVLWLATDERRRQQLRAACDRQAGLAGLHRVLAPEQLLHYITKGGDDE